jgi:hypothetical protein
MAAMTTDERIAFYIRAQTEAAAALAMPDPELDRERRLIAQQRANEAKRP